jgi:NAD(P)-dependent dehydrogenase (short-subunit alcohol dehydrogenase family)|tara:strand:+ start:146 stop:901 length:756 start_codon:yes stop_codon:yes gene_type:complete
LRTIIVGRNEEAYKEAFGKETKSLPLEFREVDISSAKEVNTLYHEFSESGLTLHALINAAGVQHPISSFEQLELEDWDRNLSINLSGTVNMIHGALPFFKSAEGGKIANFSGGGATSSRPNFSAYAVSKTAVVRLSEILAEELREYKIDVNAVAPGAINTGMLDEIIEAGAQAGDEHERAHKRKSEGGDPVERIVDLCRFLISSDSDGISGKLISAIWDPWEEETFQERLRRDNDFATLRRIDGKSFYKKD